MNTQVEANPGGMHTDLDVSIPITIGDIGFDGENPAGAINNEYSFPPATQPGYPGVAVPVPQPGYPGAVAPAVQSGYPGVVVPAPQPGFQGVAPVPQIAPVPQPGFPSGGASTGPVPYPNPYPNANCYPSANPYPNPNQTSGMGFNPAGGAAPCPPSVPTPYSGQSSTYSAVNNDPAVAATVNAPVSDNLTDKSNLFNTGPITMPSSNFLNSNSQSEDPSSQFTPLLPQTRKLFY